VTPQLAENTEFFEKLNFEVPPRPVQDASRPKIYTVGVA